MSYITTLRNLVKTCDYADKADEMVKDVLVRGHNSSAAGKLLLQESKKLTLNRAINICQVFELTESHWQTLGDKATSDDNPVDAVRYRRGNNRSRKQNNYKPKQNSQQPAPAASSMATVVTIIHLEDHRVKHWESSVSSVEDGII